MDRLLTCVEANLIACDIGDVVRIFFFYSKLKCSVKQELVAKMLERVYLFMDSLDERSYHYLVRAVASLNYHDTKLVQTLKLYNY